MKLLKYEAPWCQPCKAIEPMVTKVVNDLCLKYEKISIEDMSDEKQKEINLKSVPTFVIINDNGKEISRKVGSCTEKEMTKWIGEIT